MMASERADGDRDGGSGVIKSGKRSAAAAAAGGVGVFDFEMYVAAFPHSSKCPLIYWAALRLVGRVFVYFYNLLHDPASQPMYHLPK